MCDKDRQLIEQFLRGITELCSGTGPDSLSYRVFEVGTQSLFWVQFRVFHRALPSAVTRQVEKSALLGVFGYPFFRWFEVMDPQVVQNQKLFLFASVFEQSAEKLDQAV